MTDPAVAAGLIPDSFRSLIAGRMPEPEISGDDWLRALPGLIIEHLDRWELAPDGPAWHGECALVLPVRQGTDRLALKLTWPHVEAAHEHLALRAWAGRGAVRLVAADPSAYALLLERLDGDRDLHAVSIIDACEEIGRLLATLDRPTLAQAPHLDDLAPRWLERLAAPHPSVPRRMAAQAASHLRDLMVDGPPARMMHSDLHYANVLAGQRNSWVAIDPKPVNGDRAYAVAPAVWNRPEEAAKAYNLRVHLRMRADIVAQAAQLSEARVRAWTFVRLINNALSAAESLPSARAFHGRMIAAAKAFAD